LAFSIDIRPLHCIKMLVNKRQFRNGLDIKKINIFPLFF
jgi:hypothetical protein